MKKEKKKGRESKRKKGERRFRFTPPFSSLA